PGSRGAARVPSGPARGRVGVRVIEGIEGPGAVDLEFEPLIEAYVRDLDRQPVCGLAPEQRDLDSVACPVSELCAVLGGHVDRPPVRPTSAGRAPLKAC